MLFYIFLIFSTCSTVTVNADLDVIYSWKYIDYQWRSEMQKGLAIMNNQYNYTTNVPYDVDVAPDGRVFVTVVRTKGVPASLNTVSRRQGNGGPLLKPYPDWSLHNRRDCRSIIGVYRVAVACNLLWVLDTGKIDEDQLCPAKLWIFSLNTDALIRVIEIPKEYSTSANGNSLLVTPVVDLQDGDCNNLRSIKVYMADVEGFGLVVWNNEKLYRIESESFLPDSSAATFSIAGQSFDLSDGLLGMAIERGRMDGKERRLFFRPLASLSMYSTNLKKLEHCQRKYSNFTYKEESYKLRSQSAAQIFSRRGILFYSSLSDESLICWNHNKPFNEENNVQFVTNQETLQFASGMKVSGFQTEYLFVMTNRYQQVVNNVMDFNDVNFRISVGAVDDLVQGTNCE